MPSDSADKRARLLLALAVVAALGGLLIVAGGAFTALPALLAFLPLLAGRYIGAERLEALLEARRERRPRAVSVAVPKAARRAAVLRAGRLIAFSLAERGPPAPLALV